MDEYSFQGASWGIVEVKSERALFSDVAVDN